MIAITIRSSINVNCNDLRLKINFSKKFLPLFISLFPFFAFP